MWRWEKESVNFFEQQEFDLTLPSLTLPSNSKHGDETLEEHYKQSTLVNYPDWVAEVSLVAKNTKLTVKKIYSYSVPLCCSGYTVMAIVNGKKIKGKMINISSLFDTNVNDTLNPNKLKVEYGHVCE